MAFTRCTGGWTRCTGGWTKCDETPPPGCSCEWPESINITFSGITYCGDGEFCSGYLDLEYFNDKFNVPFHQCSLYYDNPEHPIVSYVANLFENEYLIAVSFYRLWGNKYISIQFVRTASTGGKMFLLWEYIVQTGIPADCNLVTALGPLSSQFSDCDTSYCHINGTATITL